MHHDAILLVSFGGPEGPDDVIPFLQNVTRGRNIPVERLEVVGEHYKLFGGVSPINQQNRDLLDVLRPALLAAGIDLPVYWGNRNWDPYLADALREMRDDGVQQALAVVTSAFSSWSGCRQYREDLARAQADVGDGAPEIDKVRVYYNDPGFISAQTDHVRDVLADVTSSSVRIVFTTHSIPHTMSRHSDYEAQTMEACRLVIEALGSGHGWDLVYNSRSGPPSMPWLEPDVNDHLESLAESGACEAVVVVPIGFVSDHMEVVYDLDIEAKATAERVGLEFHRAPSVGTHPDFVAGLVGLIAERVDGTPRATIGTRGANHDVCPFDCCQTPSHASPVPTVAGAPKPTGRPS